MFSQASPSFGAHSFVKHVSGVYRVVQFNCILSDESEKICSGLISLKMSHFVLVKGE